MILATDDPHARGLWEIGYELLNVLVQASGLGTACQPIVLRNEHRTTFVGLPIEAPAALVALDLVNEAPLTE